jgi:4-diphosphocytidyl-2-C-methyl-D-erythritol kinase
VNEGISERAFAKLNLVLHVGPPRGDGLHPLCSVFASLDLADVVEVEPAGEGASSDSVDCPGVVAVNLAEEAAAAFRHRVPALPPLNIRIDKRVPVAAGLGGGSADAAAVLRAANRIAGCPLSVDALREIAARLGSDVPSQVEPRNALVQGVGELVEEVELPPLAVILVPQHEGLSTARVYAQLDRMKGWRERLDPRPLRELAGSLDAGSLHPGALENDLQPAAISLRPELAQVLELLRETGSLATLVSGSGPTCFALFADRERAEGAAAGIEGAILAEIRQP